MSSPATDALEAIERVLSRLKGVKRLADGRWQALCPCHDDHRPSLGIKRCDDGTVLLKCRVGCETKAIVEQMGLNLRDLFPAKLAGNGNSAHEIVTTYDYKDADGKLIFQVCRRDDKQFPLRRPDGRGGWVWNLDGVPRVLYRLPELLAADPGAWVFIPEGEKDVDRLHAHGLVATCNPGGAGTGQRSRRCRRWTPAMLTNSARPARTARRLKFLAPHLRVRVPKMTAHVRSWPLTSAVALLKL